MRFKFSALSHLSRLFIVSCTLFLGVNSAIAAPSIWESNYGNVLTDLTDTDDGNTEVDLSFLFNFAGTDYSNVFVGTNGGLQLGSLGDDDEIDYDTWDDLDEFYADGAPTLFPFNTDLSLNATGTIHFNDFGDRAVFTWNEVGTFAEQEHLSTFQTQLLSNGTIIFGYNGILDGADEDLIDSLDEGIVVGISESDDNDPGPSNLSGGPFISTATTIYEAWCYDEEDSCDNGEGATNDAFDLDMTNVIFTPLAEGGFTVSSIVSKSPEAVPEPTSLLGLAAVSLLGFLGRRKIS